MIAALPSHDEKLPACCRTASRSRMKRRSGLDLTDALDPPRDAPAVYCDTLLTRTEALCEMTHDRAHQSQPPGSFC